MKMGELEKRSFYHIPLWYLDNLVGRIEIRKLEKNRVVQLDIIKEAKKEFPNVDEIVTGIGDRSDWIEYGSCIREWFVKWFGE